VTWYFAVILDTHDCIAARFGPISSYEVRGETGAVIERAWRDAMEPECAERAVPAAEAAASTSQGSL
jgi:hypothetical protein